LFLKSAHKDELTEDAVKYAKLGPLILEKCRGGKTAYKDEGVEIDQIDSEDERDEKQSSSKGAKGKRVAGVVHSAYWCAQGQSVRAYLSHLLLNSDHRYIAQTSYGLAPSSESRIGHKIQSYP